MCYFVWKNTQVSPVFDLLILLCCRDDNFFELCYWDDIGQVCLSSCLIVADHVASSSKFYIDRCGWSWVGR
jgi:hypothetical protein